MSNIDVMFSSSTDDWATPQDLFDKLNSVFNFEVDVCASPENAKCGVFYDKELNGLAQSWRGTCWMNPPYGRIIGEWVDKAKQSAANGATVVALLPARVDTKWWQRNCNNEEIYFIPGRIKFGRAKHSAPFPSAIVVFRPRIADILA